MKPLKYLFLFMATLHLNACKKDKKTGPFAGTTYQILGKYDGSGKPSYLMTPDIISPGMQDFMVDYTQNGKNLMISNPELFTSSAIADITITQPSTVYMTFVYQNAGAKNAIAFYNYPTNTPPATAKDIQTITYIFPNTGRNTPLVPGDKVKIGAFNAGTSIGFVLLKNAWDSESKSLNDNSIHYCTNDVLNPETDPSLKKHAVLINYDPEHKVLIGFEDTDRSTPECDHDFNDVVVYCTVAF